MKISKLIMVVCFLVAVTIARGQTYASVNGNIYFFGVIVDSVTKNPLPGAVIYQITEEKYRKLTRFIVADRDGKFQFETPNSVPTRVEISCVGYKVRKFVLPKDHQTINMGKVWLAPDIQKLDEVTVFARAKMYKQFGDTTRVYAWSVKTLKGDAVIDVLRQIPGITVNPDGSVSMEGKLVERTLLNNKLIFGDDNITALYTIDADQSTTIDIYDEEIENETSFDRRKRKVMNIRTKKDFNRYFTADALIEGGLNHDKDENGNRQKKYDLNGALGAFREGCQAQVNILRSNFANRSTRYNKVLRADTPTDNGSILGKLVRQFGDFNSYLIDSYSIVAGYSKNKNQRTSRTENTYFPTGYFESQTTSGENNRTSANEMSHVSVEGNYVSSPSIKAYFSGSFISNNTDESRLNSSETFRDGIHVTSTSNSTNSEMNRASLSSNFIFSYRLDKKNSLGINMAINHDKPKGTESCDQKIMNSGLDTRTVLGVENNSPRMDLSSSLNFKHKFDTSIITRNTLALNIGAKYNKSKTYNMAIDNSTGLVNDIYSGEYQINVKTYSAGLEFNHNVSSRRIISGVTFNRMVMNRNERMPDRYVIRKTFNTWSPYIDASWEGRERGRISLGFSVSRRIPEINLFSHMLDVSSPMFPRSGNPDLNPIKEYNFSVSHNLSLVKKQISFYTRAGLKYSTDNIVYKRQYFENNTMLPGYDDYETPAGSTLVTPVNGNDYWDLNISTSMQKQINYLGRLETIASYTFRDPQSEGDGRLVRLQEHKGTLDIKLATNFSRHVRLNLTNSTSYLWSRNSGKHEERGILNKASVHFQLSFLERVSFETGYTMDYYDPSLSDMKINSHLLNAILGYRIFKSRKGLISLNAFDILNKNTGFKTSVNDQLVSNTWDRFLESYYTISFEYKFNSQK